MSKLKTFNNYRALNPTLAKERSDGSDNCHTNNYCVGVSASDWFRNKTAKRCFHPLGRILPGDFDYRNSDYTLDFQTSRIRMEICDDCCHS